MKVAKKPTRLGETIYRAREAKGITTPRFAEMVGTNQSTMHRIQVGDIEQPRPQLLADIAEALDLNASDLFALAGYVPSTEMPNLKGWLNVKHRGLPDDAVEALQGHLEYLVNKHSNDANDQQQRKEKP